MSVLPRNWRGTSWYVEADVPHPAIKKLSVSEVFDVETGKPRADTVMKHFVKEGRLEEEAALLILTEATALLRAENTMIDVEAPVTGLASTLSLLLSRGVFTTILCL